MLFLDGVPYRSSVLWKVRIDLHVPTWNQAPCPVVTPPINVHPVINAYVHCTVVNWKLLSYAETRLPIMQ